MRVGSGWKKQTADGKEYISVALDGELHISDPDKRELVLWESDRNGVDYDAVVQDAWVPDGDRQDRPRGQGGQDRSRGAQRQARDPQVDDDDPFEGQDEPRRARR